MKKTFETQNPPKRAYRKPDMHVVELHQHNCLLQASQLQTTPPPAPPYNGLLG